MSTTPPGKDKGIIPMTSGVQIPAAVGLAVLIFISITGNAMTVLAYLRDKQLRSVYDLFLFNLGITDLLISAISLPFYTVYTLMENTWPFGHGFCVVYLMCDFTLVFQSMLLMLIISIDRLLLIQLGPSYMIRITKRVAIAQVDGTWLFSFLMFCPLIIAWDVYVGNSLAEDMVCEAKFMHDSVVVMIHAVVAFIIPFVCMTSVNVFIYVKIKQRLMMKQAGNIPVQSVSTINPDNQTATAAPKPRTDRNENRRHLKAAKFLTMIVAAFWLFWSPMAFTTVLISFCDNCLNQSLYVVFYYLIWVKSSVNPFLYAYNSPRYRTNFQRFLSCNGRLQFRKRERNVESEITLKTSPD